jgi:hypothetical protein
MPKKLVHFGIKVWTTANAISKYLWNFEVYCRKQGNPHDGIVFDGGHVDKSIENVDAMHSGKWEGKI